MKSLLEIFKRTLVGLISISIIAQPVAASAGKTYYYVKDHLGSTRVVIDRDDNSAKVATSYFAFGEKKFHEAVADFGDKQTEEFTGKEHDEISDLMYFGARYYDSKLGMWIGPDPAEQFSSPYVYAGIGTNPINMVDEDGQFLDPISAAFIIGAIYGAYQGGKIAHEKGENVFMGAVFGGLLGGNIGVLSAVTGGAIAGALGSGAWAAAAGSAVGGAMSGGTQALGFSSYAGLQGQDLWTATWKGAATGAFGGLVGGGIGSATRNFAGKGLGVLAGGAAGGSMGAGLNGEHIGWGALKGMGNAYAAFVASNAITDLGSFDGYDISLDGNAKEGDIVAFENKLKWLTGEKYGHTGVVVKDEATGQLAIRESMGQRKDFGNSASLQRTLGLKHHHSGRGYSIISRGHSVTPFVAGSPGSYNFMFSNCTQNSARWTGTKFYSNPGVQARYFLKQGAQSYVTTYYYNN